MTSQFRTLPVFGADQRAVSDVVNNIMNGKTNNTGNITLTVSATTTQIYDKRIGYDSVILFMPLNNRAADEVGHGDLYVSSRGKGEATITHGSHAYEMIFAYAIIG